MKIDDKLNAEVWARLARGKPLDALGLESVNGKVDLSGIQAPDPKVLRRFEFGRMAIAAVAPAVPEIRGVEWSNMDFSRAKLDGLRLHGCEVNGCGFSKCQLNDWRVWATRFNSCSFKGADLRDSALGGAEKGERCLYTGVDFSEADLRGTSYKAAGFEKCDFRNARLEKLDFQTSTFVDCVFEGELNDVLFYRRGFEGEEFPANEMINVDFSRARLRDVGFRGLTLERVKFPDDAEHILIRNPDTTLDQLVATLQKQEDPAAMELAAFLSIDRKWLAKGQTCKVINVHDLTETIGVEGLDLLLKILATSSL